MVPKLEGQRNALALERIFAPERQVSFYRDAPIAQKLTFVIVCACLAGLSLTCLAFETYERASFRKELIAGLSQDADSLGLATVPSLAFGDKEFATQMLAAIEPERNVMMVALYDKGDRFFAEYRRRGLNREFKTAGRSAAGMRLDTDSLTLYRDVEKDGQRIGSIVIVSDLSSLHAKMRE